MCKLLQRIKKKSVDQSIVISHYKIIMKDGSSTVMCNIHYHQARENKYFDDNIKDVILI